MIHCIVCRVSRVLSIGHAHLLDFVFFSWNLFHNYFFVVLSLMELQKQSSYREARKKATKANSYWLTQLIVVLVFGVPSIYYGSQPMPSCGEKFPGIIFEYNKWLLIYGICTTCYHGIRICFSIRKFFRVIYTVFDLCWWIIGSILWFKTMLHCESRPPIWHYGLAIFVLIIVGILLEILTEDEAPLKDEREEQETV